MSQTKEAVIAAIDDSWRDLRRALSPLTAREMVIGGVSDEWSVKDVLGHITTWEGELIKMLSAGRRPPARDINTFNAAATEAKRSLTPRDVMEQLEATHRALRDALGRAPDAYFEPGAELRRGIDGNTVLHYDEHASQIRQWVAERKKRQ